MTAVNGYCPSCGVDWLAVVGTIKGDLMCCNPDCPAPDALARMLAKPDQHRHLIDFRVDGLSVQHPLRERFDPAGPTACELLDDLAALTGPPGIGLYAVEPGGTLADAVDVPRDEVLFEVDRTPPSDPAADARQRSAWDAIPFGSIVGMPPHVVIPDDEDRFVWVLGQHLQRDEYPDLAAHFDAEGKDFGNEPGTVRLPDLSSDGVSQAVIRVKP